MSDNIIRFLIKPLLILGTMFLAASLCAQEYKLSFQKVLDDSAPGEIKVLFQDEEGFIWMGARNSLLRYNAYEFESIQYFDKNKGSYRSPYFITSIFQDSRKIIWVSSHSGLFKYDAKLGILVKPTTEDGIDDAFYSQPFQDISELPNGHLIAGGEGYGLALINRESYRIKTYRADPNDDTSLADDGVQRILVDRKNRVWVSNLAGLNLFDPETESFELYIPNPENSGSVVHNSLTSLIEDLDGNIWGGTLGQGLYIFNPEEKTFKHYLHDDKDSKSLPDNSIWDFMLDRDGKMWLGHDRVGFNWYEPETDSFNRYHYSGTKPGDLAYNVVTSLLQDRNGDLWMGHYPEGVSYHDRSTSAVSVILPDYNKASTIANNNVLAIQEDEHQNLWLAVGNGVNYLDRKTNHYKLYDHRNGGYPVWGTLSGYLDSDGIMWIGTWTQGFYRFNPDTDKFETQPSNNALAGIKEQTSKILNDHTIWAFCETNNGEFWIGTHYAGINRFDKSTGEYTRINHQPSPQGKLTNNIAWSCYEDSKGRFWVATAHGLNVREAGASQFTNFYPNEEDPHGLQSGSVLDILEDSKGRLWFGTNNGLHLYQEDTKNFKIFNESHGFNNAGVRALEQDDEGHLWLGTNNGIIRFHPETLEVTNYLSHSGIRFAGVNTGSILKSSRGEMMFGTVDGLIIIDTSKLSSNELAPPVVFTDFKIFAKSVAVNDENKTLDSVANNAESITLDYTQKMFSFEFSALNYRNPDKNQYAYKLEGFDKEWREIGHQRKAQYTNLEAGKYTFKVRGSNNNGVWSETPKSITIIQRPPPWKTWWAYTIYALSIVGALALFVNSQHQKRKRIEKQNRILEQKVAERTADLAAKNKDIQAMLSNMRQGLFTIEEDGNIHHEYSAYLEDIFNTQDIKGKNAFEFLFANAEESADLIHQQQASLASIIGMDNINYEFNAHLLTSEYETLINGKKRILSLDWSPILDDDEYVEKLMVSVRDVTELKILEKEAAGKRQELEIIGQLLNIPAKKYRSFADSAKQYLEETKSLIGQPDASKDPENIARLFRAMHTIKGNSRTHGFTLIAAAAHNAESTYSELKAKPEKWNVELLKNDLSEVELALNTYVQIYTEVLGRESSKNRDEEGVWINHSDLLDMEETLSSIKNSEPKAYQRIKQIIINSTSDTISDVLASNVSAIASIAEELGKPPPEVMLNDNGIRAKENIQSLISDVFSHILRNAIDHGIEPADERKSHGKHESGQVNISAETFNSTVNITVKDDGKGLNISKLFSKGCEIGKWQESDDPSLNSIADLIFESGLSTKENISNISGRGVGMDAVKQFIRQAGGDIQIRINSTENAVYKHKEADTYLPFETVLTLPDHYFTLSE